MDGTLFIAMVMILFIAGILLVLIYAARQQTRKAKQQLLQQLDELAGQHGLVIKHTELLHNKVVALDERGTTLVYIDTGAGLHHLLDMGNVAQVLVDRKTRKIKQGKGPAEEHTDSIALELHLKNGDLISLPFYTETQDGILAMLPLKEKADHWKNLLLPGRTK